MIPQQLLIVLSTSLTAKGTQPKLSDVMLGTPKNGAASQSDPSSANSKSLKPTSEQPSTILDTSTETNQLSITMKLPQILITPPDWLAVILCIVGAAAYLGALILLKNLLH